MRDTVLSLKKYLVDVLAEDPPFAKIAFGANSWSREEAPVLGTALVNARQWAALCAQFSVAEGVAVDENGVQYLVRTLMVDPHLAVLALTGQALANGPVATASALVPPPEWEIRTEADRGHMNLPLAVVIRVGDVSFTGSAHYADLSQPMQVQCYPAPLETVDASQAQADAIEERLQRGFMLKGRGLGRPLRVPLFDFEGVDAEAASSFFRHKSDFLRVSGFSTQQIPDEDRRQIRVLASMTMGWRRTGAVASGTQIVQTVKQNARGGT